MGHLTDQFDRLLKGEAYGSDGFVVSSISGMESHKLGISSDGFPIFFVHCKHSEQGAKPIDYNLHLINVQFNRSCQLLIDQHAILTDTYTIISLKSGSDEIKQHFLDVVYLMLSILPANFRLNELKVHIQSLTQLFSSLSAPPLKTIQGLWAELLLIERAKTPDYLLGSWHCSNTDKFDFNDGIDKLEVKSTSNSRRIHRFSADQLMPNKSSNLLIASVYTVKTGIGKSIFDLCQSIERSLNDPTKIYTLKEKVAIILGSSFEEAIEIFFDYNLAADSCKYYQIKDIPKIKADHIPAQIQNVRFDCDLSEAKTTKSDFIKSALFEAL